MTMMGSVLLVMGVVRAVGVVSMRVVPAGLVAVRMMAMVPRARRARGPTRSWGPPRPPFRVVGPVARPPRSGSP